jgi:hypothetical protein
MIQTGAGEGKFSLSLCDKLRRTKIKISKLREIEFFVYISRLIDDSLQMFQTLLKKFSRASLGIFVAADWFFFGRIIFAIN